MKLIIHLLFICLLSFPSLVIGQQLPLFTQYRNQLPLLNPAGLSTDYILEDFNISIGVAHRSQLLGIEKHPFTYLISYRQVLKQRILWGGNLIYDKAGAISNLKAYGNVACFLMNKRQHKLTLGINGGFDRYRVNFNEVLSHNGSDLDSRGDKKFNAGAGLFYVRKKRFYVGVSASQLIIKKDTNFKVLDKEFTINRQVHCFGTLGFYLSNSLGETTFWEPSLRIRYVKGVPLNLDLNIRGKVHDNFWIGIGGGGVIKPILETGTFYWEIGWIKGENQRMKISIANDYLLGKSNTKSLGRGYEINISYLLGG